MNTRSSSASRMRASLVLDAARWRVFTGGSDGRRGAASSEAGAGGSAASSRDDAERAGVCGRATGIRAANGSPDRTGSPRILLPRASPSGRRLREHPQRDLLLEELPGAEDAER